MTLYMQSIRNRMTMSLAVSAQHLASSLTTAKDAIQKAKITYYSSMNQINVKHSQIRVLELEQTSALLYLP